MFRGRTAHSAAENVSDIISGREAIAPHSHFIRESLGAPVQFLVSYIRRVRGERSLRVTALTKFVKIMNPRFSVA